MTEFNSSFLLFLLITTEDVILFSTFVNTLSLNSIIILGLKR